MIGCYVYNKVLHGYEKQKLFFLGSFQSKYVDRKCPANSQEISMIGEFFEISKK